MTHRCERELPLEGDDSTQLPQLSLLQTLLFEGFKFAILASCLVVMVFGFCYLGSNYGSQNLLVGFGIFWILWMISVFCDVFYQRILNRFRVCQEPIFTMRRKDADYNGQHRRACEDLQYHRPQKYIDRFAQKRPAPPVNLNNEELDQLLLQAKAKHHLLKFPEQCNQTASYMWNENAGSPGASKLQGLCPRMPGADRGFCNCSKNVNVRGSRSRPYFPKPQFVTEDEESEMEEGEAVDTGVHACHQCIPDTDHSESEEEQCQTQPDACGQCTYRPFNMREHERQFPNLQFTPRPKKEPKCPIPKNPTTNCGVVKRNCPFTVRD